MKYSIALALLLLAAVGYGQDTTAPKSFSLFGFGTKSNIDFVAYANTHPGHVIKLLSLSEGGKVVLSVNSDSSVSVTDSAASIRRSVYALLDMAHEIGELRSRQITLEEYARVLLWRNQEDLKKRKNRKP